MTGEGIPFWSGAKKPPSPLQFSADDPEHMTFIVSVSVMRAKMYSLPLPSFASTFTMTPAQESHLKAVAMSTHIEPFK